METLSSSYENAAQTFAASYHLHNTDPNTGKISLPPSVIVVTNSFWRGDFVAQRFVAYRALGETYGYDKERYFMCGPVYDTDLYTARLVIQEEWKRKNR
jgi:hypothetical protein